MIQLLYQIMQTNTCSSGRVLLLNHCSNLFATFFHFCFKSKHSTFSSSGQYFRNNSNNNNKTPSTLARHPRYPRNARKHGTHATHASMQPTQVRHPRHPRQHEQHTISQTLKIVFNFVLPDQSASCNLSVRKYNKLSSLCLIMEPLCIVTK